MPSQSFSIQFNSPQETGRFAAKMSQGLKPGDTLLLSGPVGAGKTHFARHLIQSVLLEPEDVPSPTFTLVQSYDTSLGVLWHADLYRVASVFEIEELGLAEAFDSSICLIEWPDRLGHLEPANALTIALNAGTAENTRHLQATWYDRRWDGYLDDRTYR